MSCLSQIYEFSPKDSQHQFGTNYEKLVTGLAVRKKLQVLPLHTLSIWGAMNKFNNSAGFSK